MADAEQWLSERGIERHALIVRLEEPQVELPDEPDLPAETDVAEPAVTEPRVIESTRVAEAAADERALMADLAAAEPVQRDNVSDDVARAVAFMRNATANTPQTEGRLRRKLISREYPSIVIDLALEQARKERLVDDVAYAAALVDEWLAKGHAGVRIRNDLRQRGFDHDLIVETMARVESPDPEAVAFAVARDRADGLSGLSPETAYRRLVAYLARRGHPQGLARKVARQVLWVEREQEQTASR